MTARLSRRTGRTKRTTARVPHRCALFVIISILVVVLLSPSAFVSIAAHDTTPGLVDAATATTTTTTVDDDEAVNDGTGKGTGPTAQTNAHGHGHCNNNVGSDGPMDHQCVGTDGGKQGATLASSANVNTIIRFHSGKSFPGRPHG